MESRYQIQRGLFNTLCGLLICIALYRSCVPSSHVPAASALPTNYRLARCALRDTKVYDFHSKNPEQITANLREGGYCDRYILPLAWAFYFIQKSQAPGDYASVWCNGHPSPGPIRRSLSRISPTGIPLIRAVISRTVTRPENSATILLCKVVERSC